MPAIHGFEENMKEHARNIQQVSEMVNRFDEIILTKASKFSIELLHKKLEDYVLVTDFNQSKEKNENATSDLNQRLKDANEDIEQINEHFKHQLSLAVRKVNNNLRNELRRNTDKGNINKDIVKEMIADKIDQIEFDAKLSMKSNVSDMETNMKAVDILHHQI